MAGEKHPHDALYLSSGPFPRVSFQSSGRCESVGFKVKGVNSRDGIEVDIFAPTAKAAAELHETIRWALCNDAGRKLVANDDALAGAETMLDRIIEDTRRTCEERGWGRPWWYDDAKSALCTVRAQRKSNNVIG